MVILIHQVTEFTRKHECQLPSNHIRKQDQSKQINFPSYDTGSFFFLKSLHFIIIGYFNKPYKQLMEIGPVTLHFKISHLIIPSLSQAFNSLMTITFLTNFFLQHV